MKKVLKTAVMKFTIDVLSDLEKLDASLKMIKLFFI